MEWGKSMISRENLYLINNYADFYCMKGQCPHTCCKNWIIAIDEDTEENIRNRIKSANLKNKIILKLSMHYENNGILSIRKVMGTCPYYTRDGLCGHEKRGDKDLMPLICRMYPRRVVQVGTSRVEVTMELSCFSAALWFLKNKDTPKLVSAIDYDYKEGKKDGDEKSNIANTLEVLWKKKNDAPSYLIFLDELRKKAIDELMDTVGIEDILFTIKDQYERICLIQNELLSNTIDGEVDHELLKLFSHDVGYADTEDIIDKADIEYKANTVDIICKADSTENAENIEDKENTDNADIKENILQLPIPITVLNRVIYECFDLNSQKKKNPVFYRLLRGYDRLFGNDSPDTAEQNFFKFYKKMVSGEGTLEIDTSVYKRYMSYCLMEEIPDAYEDYYLVGKYLFSIFYTELWMLFDVVSRFDEQTKRVFINEAYINKSTDYLEADILSAFERAFRHSPTIKKNILAIIREDYLSHTKK